MGTVLGAPIVRDSVRGVVPKVEPNELCLTGDALRVALYGLRFRADSVYLFLEVCVRATPGFVCTKATKRSDRSGGAEEEW